MTGKEALEYIANLLFMFTSAGRKSGKDYTLKALCKIEDELEELTKYKRAFEILKDLIIFDKKNQAVANGTSIIDLNKEEAELLEELMKDE